MNKRLFQAIVFLFILLFSVQAYADWKFNPFTGKLDYYEAGGAGDITTVGTCTTGNCGIEGGMDIFPFIYEGTADEFETIFAVTDPTTPDKTITFPDKTGTVALSTDKLSAFAATTSAELAGVLSDESGTDKVAFTTSPVFTTPNIGSATGSISGNAATVTTNANLTGVITSVGNATSIASQTGTGTTFVVDTSPTIVTPTITTSAIIPLVIGSTSASGTLTLQSTSHATKGKILFGTSAYDEVNNRLGIGTTGPSEKLDVAGNINIGANILKTTNYGVSQTTAFGGLAVLKVQTLTTDDRSDFIVAPNGTSKLGTFFMFATSDVNTNYEAMGMAYDGSLAAMTVSSFKGGTGTLRPLSFGVGSSATSNLFISTSGNIGIGETSPGAQLQVNTSGAAVIGQIIKGAASQSADLLQIQNSAATVLASISATGNILAAGGSANHAICWKADGKTLGYCSVVVDATGVCGTCN